MKKVKLVIASDCHQDIYGMDLIVENEKDADYFLDLGDNFCGMEPSDEYYNTWLSVRGNNDGPFAPYRRDLNIFHKNIRMVHGDRLIWDYPTSNEMFDYMKEEGVDILLFGHTHRMLYCEQKNHNGKVERVLLNPGSIGESRDYELFMKDLGSYCILTIYEDGTIEHKFKTQHI